MKKPLFAHTVGFAPYRSVKRSLIARALAHRSRAGKLSVGRDAVPLTARVKQWFFFNSMLLTDVFSKGKGNIDFSGKNL